MTYQSTVNGQMYSEAKFAPENLNFCASAVLVDTTGNRENVIALVHFPYQWGGEAQAVADAKAHIIKEFWPLFKQNMEISMSLGARPADQQWPKQAAPAPVTQTPKGITFREDFAKGQVVVFKDGAEVYRSGEYRLSSMWAKSRYGLTETEMFELYDDYKEDSEK